MAAPAAKPGLLVVDDDEIILSLLLEEFADDYDVVGARRRADVTRALKQLGAPPACALVDLGLPPHTDNPREGFALVRELGATVPGCAVIVVSGQNEEEHGKVARALGAIDYVAKPCDAATIRAALARAQAARDAGADNGASAGLIGAATALVRVARQLRQFGTADYPVLLEGESGTGKEIAARALHDASGRTGAFVAVNCAAVPEQLFEAALFGARRGSYTGANADTPGHLAAAAGGTIFLDEVGDLPLALQPKLLRTLENGEYLRVGDATSRQADVRVVAATNRPLRMAVRAGLFREDLYHRLGVLVVTMPPLRELGDDRLALLEHYRALAAQRSGTQPFSFDRQAAALWDSYHFPGNVRELRNIVARLQVVHPGGVVDRATLAAELLETPTADATLDTLLAADARRHARDALAATGTAAAAARRLGVDAARLQELLAGDGA